MRLFDSAAPRRRPKVDKSGFAALCGIGGASASKQRVQLTERGLLVQTGKGPSTRYVLAA